ncbi:hypothetical protein [Oceanibaculum indicum]|uniref:hypothetical protein n=1 Tax=Oceanibaculum indicum TaxID=526216 RepID=UPI00192B5C42|nr:hypothetical protein [Oceanibaculum indicum]
MASADIAVLPAGTRVCDHVEGEFKHLPKGLARTGLGFQSFGHHETLALQLGNALLVAGNHRLAGRFDDAVEQGCRLLLDGRHAAADILAHGGGLFAELIPHAGGHVLGKGEHLLRRLHARQHCGELPLDHLAPDGFAVLGTRPVEAHVIRMLPARLALGPAGGERLAAGAEHEAA